jgi:protein gp37
MGSITKIQWCHHTFNPWIGCSKVHEGCANCYAEADFAIRRKRVVWGQKGTRSITATWNDPVKWNKAAQLRNERSRVFCASLADVFEDWQGSLINHDGTLALHHQHGHRWTMNQLRSRLFGLIESTPWLDYLVLTKRPENVFEMWPVDPQTGMRKYLSNVWLGTSVSSVRTAETMIPHLMSCRQLVPVLFLSMEPLLEQVSLSRVHVDLGNNFVGNPFAVSSSGEFEERVWPGIDWVIVGGESGNFSRPCAVEWIRIIVNECRESNTPCFVKQLGEVAFENDRRLSFANSKKGGDPSEWPTDIAVREFPEVES